MVKRYKTKSCVIEAIQWTGDNMEEIKEFVGSAVLEKIIPRENKPNCHPIIIKTLEGPMLASENDYIIKGLRGEFYPCKPDVFEKKYKLIIEPQQDDISTLQNWEEMVSGIYCFAVPKERSYVIHINYWLSTTDILSSNSSLYVAESRSYNGGNTYELKILLQNAPLAACLERAVEHYKEAK